MSIRFPLPEGIADSVAHALAEDIGSGDVTARLVDEQTVGRARVIAREPAVICGRAWVDEVFRQVIRTCRSNGRSKRANASSPTSACSRCTAPHVRC